MLRIDDVTGPGGEAVSIIAEYANYYLAIATCKAVSLIPFWGVHSGVGPQRGIDFLGFVTVASSCYDSGTYKIPTGKSNGEGERAGCLVSVCRALYYQE